MSNKTFNTRDLAMFFAQNEEKDNIISAIFNHFLRGDGKVSGAFFFFLAG